MKVLAHNIPIKLGSRTYAADVVAALYASGNAAVLLVESANSCPEHSVLAIASSNFPQLEASTELVAAKDYSENAGLWKQLLQLKDPQGDPLFTSTAESISSGFVEFPIYNLSPWAEEQVIEMLAESVQVY